MLNALANSHKPVKAQVASVEYLSPLPLFKSTQELVAFQAQSAKPNLWALKLKTNSSIPKHLIVDVKKETSGLAQSLLETPDQLVQSSTQLHKVQWLFHKSKLRQLLIAWHPLSQTPTETGDKLLMWPKNSQPVELWELPPSNAHKNKSPKTTVGQLLELVHADIPTLTLSASQYHAMEHLFTQTTSRNSVIPTASALMKWDMLMTLLKTLRRESMLKSIKLWVTFWVELSKKSYPAALKDVLRFEMFEVLSAISNYESIYKWLRTTLGENLLP